MDLQGRHNSTAQAIEESKALVWDTNMFKAALSRFPILERNTQGILERRIRELEQRFCEVATEKASARDRKSVVKGKSVDLGGRRIIKKIIRVKIGRSSCME